MSEDSTDFIDLILVLSFNLNSARSDSEVMLHGVLASYQQFIIIVVVVVTLNNNKTLLT